MSSNRSRLASSRTFESDLEGGACRMVCGAVSVASAGGRVLVPVLIQALSAARARSINPAKVLTAHYGESGLVDQLQVLGQAAEVAVAILGDDNQVLDPDAE